MNTSIFNDIEFQKAIKNYYPEAIFSEHKPFYDLEKVRFEEFLNEHDIIKKSNFFCYLNQTYYGYVTLENEIFIISVDDEGSISIAGDSNVNWMQYPLSSIYEDFDDYLKKFNHLFNTSINHPNFNKFYEIEEKCSHLFN